MKFKYFILAALVFFLNINYIFSQRLVMPMDSLRQVIKTAKIDTIKINAINWLSYQYYLKNSYDSSLQYAKEALSLSEKFSYKNGKGFAYTNYGNYYLINSDYPLGLKYYFQALKLFEEINNNKFIAYSFYNIGYCYKLLNNYSDALNYLFKCLKLLEELDEKLVLGATLSQMGSCYEYLDNMEEAEKKYYEALKVCQQSGDKFGIALISLSIGRTFSAKGHYSEALQKYREALKIYQASENQERGLYRAYASIAIIYVYQGDSALEAHNLRVVREKYSEAEKNYSFAFKYQAKYDSYNISYLYKELGTLYFKTKKYLKAKSYLEKGLKLSLVINDKEVIKMCYLYLSKLDSLNGNYPGAYGNFKKYILYQDSLTNTERVRKSEGYKIQYEFTKKEDSLKQKHFLTESKLQVQRKEKYFYWAGLFMLGLLSIFVFLNFRNQKKINRLAGEAHTRNKTEMVLQNQQAILSERLRISSELHDEVGATLSGIAMYSHLTKEQLKAGQTTEIEKSLNVMQQSSAQMVDKLNDIVWLINPDQDSLEKLIERLEEYATNMAAVRNMQVRVSVPEKIAEINLPVESRRNIYLFCKEAINNAVKYSNATLLELTVKETGGKLEFSVSDNGKGFDAVMVRRGNGLENMQKRADEIGAKLVLQSKESEGASVSLQCKIS